MGSQLKKKPKRKVDTSENDSSKPKKIKKSPVKSNLKIKPEISKKSVKKVKFSEEVKAEGDVKTKKKEGKPLKRKDAKLKSKIEKKKVKSGISKQAKAENGSKPNKKVNLKSSKIQVEAADIKKPFKIQKPVGKKFPGSFNITKGSNQISIKPTDWADFKKKKKEVQTKRKQNRALFNAMSEPKKLGEKIRMKNFPEDERKVLIESVHTKLKGKQLYEKFVMIHDMARLVQILLKFSSSEIREEISRELIPHTVEMLMSKYGKFCIKRMLKYGNTNIRNSIIKAMYGHAVRLCSHIVSAPVFEYAYSTWATQQAKLHLIQEFFGDLYRSSKDDTIKHLRDIYKNSPDMKSAALSAVKGNLSRIINKNLYDSGLVQSVLFQYLQECSNEDRNELISQLAPHVVILGNSKDGARAVMTCIWHGSNKDRKVIMKAFKEHVVEVAKHEHGHCSLICLLDTIDDTVLLNKMIISEMLKSILDLGKDEWGRKVLLWLVAPGDSKHFHPQFIKELDLGRETSTCKKSKEIRRKEILEGCCKVLLRSISDSADVWLSSRSMGILGLAILKAGSGDELKSAFESITKIITDPNWKITVNSEEVAGVDDGGMHMILKKLAQGDKNVIEDCVSFGEVLLETLNNDSVSSKFK